MGGVQARMIDRRYPRLARYIPSIWHRSHLYPTRVILHCTRLSFALTKILARVLLLSAQWERERERKSDRQWIQALVLFFLFDRPIRLRGPNNSDYQRNNSTERNGTCSHVSFSLRLQQQQVVGKKKNEIRRKKKGNAKHCFDSISNLLMYIKSVPITLTTTCTSCSRQPSYAINE